ncbi:Zinc finger protein castor 1 [Tyrophagus putrescentiae]|nr:Zinc finger protein castor 1 [Tyrophagus putrescentiae]
MTSIEDSGPNKTGDKVLSTKNSSSKANSIDIEKLKQLQELNKLLLLQQQIEQQQNSDLQNHNKHQISSPLDSLTLDPTALFSSLDQQFHQHQQQQKSFPSSSGALLMKMKAQAAAAVASSDAYNFGDIFKSKPSSNSGGGGGQGGGNGGNKPSRRPLSSWKQSISACGPGPAPWVDKATLHSLGIPDELINNAVQIDYTNYVKRYGNAAECGNALCGELNYREHFHCNAASCNSRVFMKKEEMIRHFKWHKKRDESLTHGFLRCSPADNCVERFRACPAPPQADALPLPEAGL